MSGGSGGTPRSAGAKVVKLNKFTTEQIKSFHQK